MFKNKVGRPSNKTIRNRKLFYGGTVLFLIIVIFSAAFILNKKESKNVQGLIFNGTSISVTYNPSNRKAEKNEQVTIYVKYRIPDTKEYYYNFFAMEDGVEKKSVCSPISSKLSKYEYKIKADQSNYMKFAIYEDPDCSKKVKEAKTKEFIIKKATTTQEKTFTATFNKNGADSIGASTLTCKTKTGKCTVTAPSITRKGYKVTGWAKKTYLPAVYKVGKEITLTGNKTFYAKTYKTTALTVNSIKNPVDVKIKEDSQSTTVKFNTIITIPTTFSNSSQDKYYYKWITYAAGNVAYQSGCLQFKDGYETKPTLTINDVNRYGEYKVYKDDKCTDIYKTYKTSTYNPSSIELPTVDQNLNYYYSKLNDRKKIIYRYLLYRKNNFLDEKDIYMTTISSMVPNMTAQEIFDAHSSLYSDFPEYYYFLKNTSTYVGGFTNNLIFGFKKQGTSSKMKSELKKINGIVSNVISTAKTKNGDYNKIKYVHDYIVKNMTYKVNIAYSIDGYTVKQGQCMTYAFMYLYALKQLNIPTIYVAGELDTGGLHAWNHVKLNGKWYLVDVTWDDPSDNLRYSYFLKGKNNSNLSGRKTALSKFPTLSATDY